MHIVRLSIRGFRGIATANVTLGKHSVLVGPNNSGKTSILEALAHIFGRDRLVRRLTEHDFYGSMPNEKSRIVCVATVTGFTPNDPQHHGHWFSIERGVERWYDPTAKSLSRNRDCKHTELAVQIGFAARFDLDNLTPETVRFFLNDEVDLEDPFGPEAHLRIIHGNVLQDLGFFLVPASRTWDRWISFTSELFRRVVGSLGRVPADAVRQERQRLWQPPEAERLEGQDGLKEIVATVNDELEGLLADAPKLQLRLTATDSDSLLEAVVPHYARADGPSLPSVRQGTGLVSLQSLLLLMQFGKARAKARKSFMLAVEEPELHIQPSQQKRLVNRLNALCDQTIVTTHSPMIAAMFAPTETLFVETRSGELSARPLVEMMPAQPTNHEQHLLFAWRQKLLAALMHERVLIPEGVSDVAWLETLQTSLEVHQGWHDQTPLLSTFVGVVPTIDAKIADTHTLVSAVHSWPCILVDGDSDGRRYFDQVRVAKPPPRVVVFWPTDWKMENVVAWLARADETNVLSALKDALGVALADCDKLAAYLEGVKSYAPAHETVALALMANAKCRARARQLLNALCEVLRDPTGATTLYFTRVSAESTETMQVFRLTVPT